MLAAFRAECAQLTAVLSGLDDQMLELPTDCPPWTVRELMSHVETGAGRLVDMLAEPAPPRAEVDAAGYFGPAKFTQDVDSARIDSARAQADRTVGAADLAARFDRTWRATHDAVRAQPPGRTVRTRHGDAMTVEDFLTTRVVEVGVHGIDLALALGRTPWLTGPAAEVIVDLLCGRHVDTVPPEAGGDRLTLVARATGRHPVGPDARAALDRLGVRPLSFAKG